MEKHPTSLKFFLIFFYPLKIKGLQNRKYDALRHLSLNWVNDTAFPLLKYFKINRPSIPLRVI